MKLSPFIKKAASLTIIILLLILIIFNSCSQTDKPSSEIVFELKITQAYSNPELFPTLIEINEILKKEIEDTLRIEDTGVGLLDKMIEDDKAPKSANVEFPLWSILYPSVRHGSDTLHPYSGAVLGTTKPTDTTLINNYFKKDNIAMLLPNDISFRYNSIPETNGDYLQLFGLKNKTSKILSDNDFNYHLDEGGFYDLFSGVHREVAKAVDGESYAMIINLNSNFLDNLSGDTFVLNCKLGNNAYLIPVDRKALTEPLTLGVLDENEKDLLMKKSPNIQIN